MFQNIYSFLLGLQILTPIQIDYRQLTYPAALSQLSVIYGVSWKQNVTTAYCSNKLALLADRHHDRGEEAEEDANGGSSEQIQRSLTGRARANLRMNKQRSDVAVRFLQVCEDWVEGSGYDYDK